MIMRRFYLPCDNHPMCGRYALHSNPDVVALLFGLSEVPAYQPRYNIAPTSQVLIVRQEGAVTVRWGLVPRWAKDPSIGVKMKNARAETVAEKPSFREAYRKRRCLIPANGFYDWKVEGGRKQPYYIHPSGNELFAFAGLWEPWQDLLTCTIITTEANEKMAAIGDRMPVIVAPSDYKPWLAGDDGLLHPCPEAAIGIHQVNRAVNNARNDLPELVKPDDS
jgi:putative SOS response-associated peptidase YedK